MEVERTESISSVTRGQLLQTLMKSQSKAMRAFMQGVDSSQLIMVRDETPQNLERYLPSTLIEDVYALLHVAGLELFFNRPPQAVSAPDLDRPEEGRRGPRPEVLPRGVTESLENLFHAPAALLAGYESERPEEMPFYRKSGQDVIWSLQELAMEAFQGQFLRDDDKYNSFLNARLIPRPLQNTFQQLLPLDIPIFKAALTIDEGVFWKKLIESRHPHIYCSPKIERTTYKSVFLQQWLADYLSSLEPGNVSYNEIKKNLLAVSIWIIELDINGLKPPRYKKTLPPKRTMPDKEWERLDKETCLRVDPYPDKINIKEILKCLSNLRHLSICYGFENYERVPTFRHTRISQIDIDRLGAGCAYCRRLVSLRLHKSAIYSQDTIILCQYLRNVPIKKLEISTCFVDDTGVAAIANMLRYHKYLEVLDLSRNCMCENGAYYVAVVLTEKNIAPLRSLNLSFNKIGDIGGVHLGLMLSVNSTLGSLGLAGCGLGAPGARVLGSGLAANRLLLRLDLSGNNLSDGTSAVLAGAEAHPRVEHVQGLEGLRDIGRRHRAFNRSYAALRELGGGERYRLAEVRVSRFQDHIFPSYNCPGEEGSPSDTESELTEPAGYQHDPVLTRYAGEFRREDQLFETRQAYIHYLEKKANCTLQKGLRDLYQKGTPLAKLLNITAEGQENEITNIY